MRKPWGSKVTTLVKSLTRIESLDKLELMKLYGRTLVTAFVQVYVAGEQDYQVYLQPSYWQYISTEFNPIYFVDSSAVLSLTESYNRLPPAGMPHDVLEPAAIHQISSAEP